MIDRGDLSPSETRSEAAVDHNWSSRCAQLGADASTWSKVAGIIDRARARNLDRAAELAAWADVALQGRLSAENRLVAAQIAHQLAGSAGTFGYRSATDIAREVERQFTEGEGEQHWSCTCDRIRELQARLYEAPEVDNTP